MKSTVAILILVLVCLTGIHAQEITFSSDSTKKLVRPVIVYAKPPVVKPPKPIRHELSFGLRLNTDGWGIYTDFGKVKGQDVKKIDMFHNVKFLQLEFGEIKNPKEQKIRGGTNNYIYGKVNNFYSLKIGAGIQKMIAGKPDPGSVSIHWSNSVGFALGLLKPYYINVYGSLSPTTGTSQSPIKYSDINQDDFLDKYRIKGSAGFSKGLDEMTFIPGGYLRSAIHVDFAANKIYVLSLETGVNAEFYSQDVLLMASQKPSSSFYNLFIAFQFGKRW